MPFVPAGLPVHRMRVSLRPRNAPGGLPGVQSKKRPVREVCVTSAVDIKNRCFLLLNQIC